MSIKNKEIKNLGKKLVENWAWIAIFVYIITTIIGWIGYIIGIISLVGILLTTIGIPIFIIGILYIRKLESRTIYKYVWIITGAAFFGGLIWFVIAYIFQGAPWAPLRDSEFVLQIIFSIGSTIICWGIGGYIGYEIGKRRNFKPLG